MIVPAMSNAEVVNELLSDYESVNRKSRYTVEKELKILFKTKKFPVFKAFDYVTPKSKNRWIYMLDMKSKNEIYQIYVNYHYTQIGLRAALVMTDGDITFLNGHLFQRFVEREGLDISNPVDRMKEFFRLNQQISYQVNETLPDGTRKMIGTFKTGVVLGIRKKIGYKRGLVICNTYISNDMLQGNQGLIISGLKEELDNYQAREEGRKV